MILIVLMPPNSVQGAEVPFHLVNNLIIVQAEIGHKKGNFILDTGADNLILHEQKMAENNVSVLFSLGGISASQYKKVPRFAFGNNTFKNLAAVTTDLSPVSQYVALPIDGIIGAGMLKNSNILIDFEHREIKFLSLTERSVVLRLKNEISFKMIDGVPVAKVKIGFKNYRFILDSGATIHLIDKKIINNSPELFEVLPSDIKLLTVGGQPEENFKLYRSTGIRIGKTPIENVNCASADFSDFQTETGIQIDGVISISRLVANNQLIIDFEKGSVFY